MQTLFVAIALLGLCSRDAFLLVCSLTLPLLLEEVTISEGWGSSGAYRKFSAQTPLGLLVPLTKFERHFAQSRRLSPLRDQSHSHLFLGSSEDYPSLPSVACAGLFLCLGLYMSISLVHVNPDHGRKRH